MKKIFSMMAVPVLAALLLAGCDNAEYKAVDNSVYLMDADGSAKSTTITMENGVIIPINVRLAKKAEEDIEVAIGFNAGNIDKFNELNGTEYQSLPADMLPTDATVTIPAGEISGSYNLHIDDFETNGVTYAVPVQIDGVLQGSVPVSGGQGQFIYVLAKPLIVSVPIMSGASGQAVKAAPETEWGINVDAWTMEAWIRMSGYNRNNQAIFSSGSSDHEIYIRFGDANRPYNYLQIKTLGGQVETAKDLVANTWYHWAFVYDGTTLTIYRNGVKDVSFNPPAPKGGQVRIDKVSMIASGSNYFVDRCSMSQMRFWKVARSEAEIQANMYYEVDPSNPNLIAYWPMDEGEGNVFADVTGNGHDATAGSLIIKSWEDGVRFDTPNE